MRVTHQRIRPYFACLAVGFGLFAGGCGGAGDGYSGPRGEVTGKVTFQGDTVPEGSVVMFQSAEGKTYTAVGTVKSDGTFRLLSNGNRLLPAVTYKVQVGFPPSGDAAEEPPDPADVSGKSIPKVGVVNDAPPFPHKFTSVQTSGVTFTVEEGLNEAEIVLEE